VLGAFTAQATAALERSRLAESAAQTVALQAADKMRTALLAAVSHDLRAPLAAARAAVSTLADGELVLAPEDHAELLEIAEQSLAGLTRLVEDLLDMSRVQAGALKPRLAPIDVEDVVEAALASLPGGTDRIRTEPPGPGLPRISADGPLLERVIANLLANALKHTDSPVSVSAEPAGDRVLIKVADHGAGIPHSARELVFRPFQRLGDRDNAAGVGLGLALARGLTESMGGTLSPEDTPGGGLTMVVSLPARLDEAEPV
jgi:two-component system, OmpR family, sensor histidine kinase KdpD